jgi:hypothetical protein
MTSERTTAQRDRLQALADFADTFAAPGFGFGTWHRPPPDESGVTDLPSFVLSPEASAFEKAAYDFDWVQSIDWSGWRDSEEGKRLTASPEQVATATEEQLGRFLTAIIRGARFNEGRLATAFNKGFLTAIVQRAEALVRSEFHTE